jgi:PAS domain S-box-containing protein
MTTPIRILMVEDCEDACVLIAAETERHGYLPRWRRVETDEQMRQALGEQDWDVIIADYVVPGFDALASVKVAQELVPDLPFLVVSGNLGEEVAVAVMKAGAHDYINKRNLTRLVPAMERSLRETLTRRARRKAEAALVEKEALGRAVLDSLTAQIAVLDRQGAIVATNAAWDAAARSGATEGSLSSGDVKANIAGWSKMLGADEKVLASIRAVLDGQLPNCTMEHACPSTSDPRWYLLNATPLAHAGGGAVVSHIDLTPVKQAEEALRQSEARFRGVVESLGEGLLLTDLNDFVWYANSRMAALTGYRPSEMVRRPASTFIRSPGRSVGQPLALDGRLAPPPDRAEVEIIGKDGCALWAEVNAAPLRDSQGQVIGTVRAITDMSERRQSREALRKSQASLLLAQRIGHVGSWEVDLASRLMEWSAETYRIFELVPFGTRPSLDDFLGQLSDEDRRRVKDGFDKAARDGGLFRTDCRLVRPDGTHRFVHLQVQAIVDQEDRTVQLVGTVQDITERKLLEEQVRHSQKMDAVGQLAGGIAHDFNNILTVIQGYTELIGCQSELDDQTGAYARQIAVSAERASKLTRQLLAFSRKQVMQLKSVDLNAQLNILAPMLQRLLGEQCQLNLHLQADLPTVVADSGMLEQVLVNLVVNARDAMPKGGRLIIETSLHQIDQDYCRIHPEASPGQFLCLGVIDTGCGMAPETVEHIFEPFFTTKEVGRGTGLGLPTVYGIVQQHHGWIQVASEFGRGSAFKIFLPLAGQTVARFAPSAQTTLVPGGAETILLAEDEPLLRQMARSILERYGYQVLEAGTGPEALAAWKSCTKHVDLLLTDMVMPGGMTGRELALCLREQEPSLKVLYTSGYSLDFVESDLLLTEGVNFVPKPYSGTSLGQAVRACLDRPGTAPV